MADPTPDATPDSAIDEVVDAKVAERLRRQQDLLTRPPEPGKSGALRDPEPGWGAEFRYEALRQKQFPPPPPDTRVSLPDGRVVQASTPRLKDEVERAWKEARVFQSESLIEDLRRTLERERERIVELRTTVDETWADVETLGKPLLDADLAGLPPGHQARVDSLDVRFLRRLAWASALKDLEHAQESERVLVAEINAAKAAIRQP